MSRKYELTVRDRMKAKFPGNLMGGSFRGNPYSHIFKNLKDNFIDGKFPVKKCLRGKLTAAAIKYHYAEHVNSSQTMCIAYFKKFFELKNCDHFLAEILKKHGIDLSDSEKFSDAVFEYIPCAKEGTNFDFFLKTDSGRQITWEVKFTESEFGGTTKGGAVDGYIKKYEKTYIPMLRRCAYYNYSEASCDEYKCFEAGALNDGCSDKDKCSIYEFYKYYQIRRNILYAEKEGDYVLFLTPRENESLNEGREYIEQYSAKWKTKYIKNICWEDLLETTLEVVACVPELFDYYTKFKEKYFE